LTIFVLGLRLAACAHDRGRDLQPWSSLRARILQTDVRLSGNGKFVEIRRRNKFQGGRMSTVADVIVAAMTVVFSYYGLKLLSRIA
jgi:hypothetical protein